MNDEARSTIDLPDAGEVLVEFVGPSSPATRWPKPLERGIVLSVGEAWARVAWTGSAPAVDWPTEWLRAVEPAEPSLTSTDGAFSSAR